MAKYLFVFNDSPHGSQRAYNGLRLASALARKAETRVFLLGDGVINALAGLNPAHADYNPQELLKQIASTGAIQKNSLRLALKNPFGPQSNIGVNASVHISVVFDDFTRPIDCFFNHFPALMHLLLLLGRSSLIAHKIHFPGCDFANPVNDL
jgi:hypothetical protein